MLKVGKKAADCGADIIKFQMHIPEHETLINAPSPSYFKMRTDILTQRTSFNLNEWKKIKIIAKIGERILCSPFSIEAIDLLKT